MNGMHNYPLGLRDSELDLLEKINKYRAYSTSKSIILSKDSLIRIFQKNNVFATNFLSFPLKYIEIRSKRFHLNFREIFSVKKKKILAIYNEFDLLNFFLKKRHLDILNKKQLNKLSNLLDRHE